MDVKTLMLRGIALALRQWRLLVVFVTGAGLSLALVSCAALVPIIILITSLKRRLLDLSWLLELENFTGLLVEFAGTMLVSGLILLGLITLLCAAWIFLLGGIVNQLKQSVLHNMPFAWEHLFAGGKRYFWPLSVLLTLSSVLWVFYWLWVMILVFMLRPIWEQAMAQFATVENISTLLSLSLKKALTPELVIKILIVGGLVMILGFVFKLFIRYCIGILSIEEQSAMVAIKTSMQFLGNNLRNLLVLELSWVGIAFLSWLVYYAANKLLTMAGLGQLLLLLMFFVPRMVVKTVLFFSLVGSEMIWYIGQREKQNQHPHQIAGSSGI